MPRLNLASAIALLLLFTKPVHAAIELEKKVIEIEGRNPVTVYEGSLSVPEVRTKAESNSIELGFRVLKGAAGTTGDPLFVFAGGPGGSFNQTMDEGKNSYYGPTTPELFTRYGDVVLLDLRGVYLSKPNLICDGPPFALRSIKTEEDFLQLSRDAAAACRKKFLDAGIDLSGYTILEAAQDVIDVADALGYDQFAVYGASFGSFYAITLAKYHPERVSKIIINAVESLDDTIDDYAAVLERVRRISQLAGPAWQNTHGAVGPLEAVENMYQALESDPEAASGLTPFELSLSLTQGINHDLSDRAGMGDWPQAMAELVDGQVFVRKLFRWALPLFIGRGNRPGVAGTFDCATGVSRQRRQYLEDTAPVLFKPYIHIFEAGCEAWDVPRLPLSYFDEFQVDTPTLILHGDIDISTPLVNAERVQSLFTKSQLTIIEGGSHSSFWEAVTQIDGFGESVIEWLKDGKPMPASVSLPNLDFQPVEL